MANIKPEILQKADAWLSDTFDEETKAEISRMKAENPQELEESFYKNAEFGTGGMRGIMGVGTNRINKYTLGKHSGSFRLSEEVFSWRRIKGCDCL